MSRNLSKSARASVLRRIRNKVRLKKIKFFIKKEMLKEYLDN